MSEYSFVYPDHEIYRPYLDLTERTELEVIADKQRGIGLERTFVWPTILKYRPANIPIELAFPEWTWETAPKWAKQPGVADEWFNQREGGINTLSSYKRWPGVYQNIGRRIMRNVHQTSANVPQANEILCYGVGTLRPRKPDTRGLKAALGETAIQVSSAHKVAKQIHLVDVDVNRNGEWSTASVAWESTNLIMPDTFGELCQLVERADDEEFLDSYLRDLRITMLLYAVPNAQKGDEYRFAPEGVLNYRRAWREMQMRHLNTGLWHRPPENISELVERAVWIINNTYIDHTPKEVRSASREAC